MVITTNASGSSSVVSTAPTVATMEYLECDYERDCSPLYKAIENAIVEEEDDYDHIVSFLETGVWPHDPAGTISGPSPEIQAKTWVTRFNPKEKRKVEWSQLPLHLAIVGGAPSSVIGALVKLYPQGLRCTDDQQMLPLHLALRHGADDEIVAFLLMQFPEAVNAKGKNGRTPVDCALRARDKLRGIILETFVEKTKSKLQAQIAQEQEELSAALEDKTIKLAKAEADFSSLLKDHSIISTEFSALKELNTKMENELSSQIQELTKEKAELEASTKPKIEKLTSEKLTESIELQKKIDALIAEKAAAEEAALKAKEEEALMRKELEIVQKSVASSVSADDWTTLKKEVDTLQAYRLTRTKSQTKENIESLKGEIEKTLEETKSEANELKTELKSLQKTVSKLEKTETTVKSTDDVAKLQAEVEALRTELRERNEAAKLNLDLAVLKKAMEVELKKTEGKSKEQLAAIERAVAKTNPRALETKSNTELAALKAELESLSLELKETELARNTAVDIEELDRALDIAMKEADPKTKGELAKIKPAVDNLRKYIENNKSNDHLVGVAKDVETLKDLLRKKQTIAKIQLEAIQLKNIVDAELVRSAGKAQEKELLEMKETIASITSANLETKDVEDLEKMKGKLNTVKKQLKEVEEATKTHQELYALKKTVEEELLRATEKAEKEISEMKKAVDAVNLEQQQSKNLKESLATEIKKANGQTEKELLDLKQKVESINISALESKNKGEWEFIRKDMESLKEDLKQKQLAKLEDTEKELAAVKAAIAQINVEQESKTNVKFEELRKEMNALRETLTPAPSSPKKGQGLMKLITSRFRRSAPGKRVTSLKPRAVTASKDDVPTILPPSMSGLYPMESDVASSDDEDGLPPAVQKVHSMEKDSIQQSASKEMEATLSLHRAAEQERQAKIDAAAVSALPSFSPSQRGKKKMLPSAMRKVKSMDPRLKSVTIDPYEIVRTWSKTVIQENGEVELETVDEDEVEVTTRRRMK